MNRNFGRTLLAMGLAGAVILGCDDSPTRRVEGTQGPTPPTRLSARFVTATQIRLDWTDNSTVEEGFDIFESMNTDSAFAKVSSALANAEYAYLDGKSSRLKYYYKIRAFSDNGASAFSNIFLLEGGSMLAKLKIPEGSMRCAAFSHDGSKIGTGSGDYKVRLWDWETESVIMPLLYHESAVIDLSFSPGGGRLASSDDVQTVIWDLNSGQYYTSFVGTRAQYSSDGRYLLAQVDTVSTLFDATTFNVVHILDISGARREFGFSSDGRWLVAGSPLTKYDLTSADDTLRAVQIISHYIVHSDTLDPVKRWGGDVTAFSSGAEFVLSGSAIIRLADSTWISRIDHLAGTCFAISPDGTKLVSGTNDWKIMLWSIDTGELTRELSGHEYSVYSVAWSPNSVFVVSASGDRTARLWGPFE